MRSAQLSPVCGLACGSLSIWTVSARRSAGSSPASGRPVIGQRFSATGVGDGLGVGLGVGDGVCVGRGVGVGLGLALGEGVGAGAAAGWRRTAVATPTAM